MSSNKSALDVAVVIPFFQKKVGLLTQCVSSIFSQPGCPNFTVIVVDDESPIPAEQELAGLPPEKRDRIQIIRQKNSGPGSARNMGLDHVPPDTAYVTFLDSDDQWTGPFLENVVYALAQGYDVFIGNSTRIGLQATRFEWDRDPARNIRPDDHLCIDPERELFEYRGDFFDLLVRRSSIISTTTMAYRFDRFPSIRFNTDIHQGEDRLFKLELGQEATRIAFSPKTFAHEGEGINIFDKSQWGTPGSIQLISNYIRLSKCILSDIRLSPDQRSYVQDQLAVNRRSFAWSIAHLLKQGVKVDWQRVLATLREDPATAALFVPNLARGLLGKLRRE